MLKVNINEDKCKGCLLCVDFCPRKLIKKRKGLNKRGVNAVKVTDQDKCLSCGFCAIICPDCCIEVYK